MASHLNAKTHRNIMALLCLLITTTILSVVQFVKHVHFTDLPERAAQDSNYDRLVKIDRHDTGLEYRTFMDKYERTACPGLQHEKNNHCVYLSIYNSLLDPELIGVSSKLSNRLDNSSPSSLKQLDKRKLFQTIKDEKSHIYTTKQSTSPELKRFVHSVGLVLAITTRQDEYERLEKSNMTTRMPFFVSLIPSFCRTASRYYDYHFFLAFDENDPNLPQKQFREDMVEITMEMIRQTCPQGSQYSLHFIQCPYRQRVTWAQNDAAMAAYTTGIEYIYRINDDTNMTTVGWTETFISILRRMDPPNIGICGPRHIQGNLFILTYEFVHRTHVDIMGCYYPRTLKNWDGDVWMSFVYGKLRTIKVRHVRLIHTIQKGRRYNVTMSENNEIRAFIDAGRITINRYIEAMSSPALPDPKKVIAMSINLSSPAQMWGAIRNAQVRRVHLPDWTMRVYVTCDVTRASTSNIYEVLLPSKVLRTLSSLGVQVTAVDEDVARQLPVEAWRYLVADDPDVKYFIIRDPEGRLGERDERRVSKLLFDTSNQAAHTSVHTNTTSQMNSHRDLIHGSDVLMKRGIIFVQGFNGSSELWGAHSHTLRTLLGKKMKEVLLNYQRTNRQTGSGYERFGVDFTRNEIWPKFFDVIFDKDVIRYDEHEVPLNH